VYRVTQLDFVSKENLRHIKNNFLTIISENIFKILPFYCFNHYNFIKTLCHVNNKLTNPFCFETSCRNAVILYDFFVIISL
jgi:hypothetical protein